MPRVCTICSHGERLAINAALVAGEPRRAIAARFALSESAVKRHAADHLPVTLLKAAEAAEVAESTSLLEQVNDIQRRARAYETQAASDGDLRIALLALREERATVALAARMAGKLDVSAPQEPFVPIVYRGINPETGEEEILDPHKMFPDPVPPPDTASVLASLSAAAKAARASVETHGAGHVPTHGVPGTPSEPSDTT